MALPDSVQKQVKLVEEIEKHLSGELQAPQNVEQETQKEQGEPKSTETVESNRDEDFRKLEARYKTLQGMHQADNQRFREQMEAAERDRQALLAQINELKQKATESKSLLAREEDEEAFGKDMAEFVRRAAKEEVSQLSPEADKIKAEVEAMKRELEAQRQMKADEARANFFHALDNLLPNWRVQNEDPEFLTWLAGPHPQYTYRTWQSFLEEALRAGDAAATANIFKAFNRTPEAPKANPLARQVAPAHNRNTPPQETQPQKKVFTESEIKDFYDGVRRGWIRGDEAKRMEEEIDRAVSEGRVSN